MSTSRSPGAGLSPFMPPPAAPLTTSRIAPVAPRTMPPAFFSVIGSLSITHASTITHIGMVVVITDASPGEVSPTPKRKHP